LETNSRESDSKQTHDADDGAKKSFKVIRISYAKVTKNESLRNYISAKNILYLNVTDVLVSNNKDFSKQVFRILSKIVKYNV
jgi:hypothetical protein